MHVKLNKNRHCANQAHRDIIMKFTKVSIILYQNTTTYTSSDNSFNYTLFSKTNDYTFWYKGILWVYHYKNMYVLLI